MKLILGNICYYSKCIYLFYLWNDKHIYLDNSKNMEKIWQVWTGDYTWVKFEKLNICSHLSKIWYSRPFKTIVLILQYKNKLYIYTVV